MIDRQTHNFRDYMGSNETATAIKSAKYLSHGAIGSASDCYTIVSS